MLDVDFLFHKNKLRDKANMAAKRSLITIVSLTIPFLSFIASDWHFSTTDWVLSIVINIFGTNGFP